MANPSKRWTTHPPCVFPISGHLRMPCWDSPGMFKFFGHLRMLRPFQNVPIVWSSPDALLRTFWNVRIVRLSLDVETLPERSNYPAFSECPVENLRERPKIVRFRLHKCKPSGRSYCWLARLCVHLLSLSIESTVEFPAAQHLWVICLNKLTWRINHNNTAVRSRRLSFFAEAGAFGVFFPSICLPAKSDRCFYFLLSSPPLTHLWEERVRSGDVNNAALWKFTFGIMTLAMGPQYTLISCSWLLFFVVLFC